MRTRTMFAVSCLAAWFVAGGSATADGKLARARQEASSSGSSDSTSDSRDDSDDDHHRGYDRHRHHHDHDHDHGPGLAELVVCGMFGGCGSDDDAYETPPLGYASYPYASPLSPYLLETEVLVASTSIELDAQLAREQILGRPFAGHVMFDAGFGAGIGHGGVDLRLLTPSPFELGVRTSALWEPTARDYSLFGAAELGLRFVEMRPLTVRLIGGLLFFGQFGQLIPGPEIGLGADLFLGRPWVLSARLAGGLFNEALVPQVRLQLGYLFGRSEVFVAYEYLKIGSVDLSAPLLGLRIWL